MGLSYSDIKQLTTEEETFLVSSYMHFNSLKNGSYKKNKNNKVKAGKIDNNYRNEIEKLRREAEIEREKNKDK